MIINFFGFRRGVSKYHLKSGIYPTLNFDSGNSKLSIKIYFKIPFQENFKTVFLKGCVFSKWAFKISLKTHFQFSLLLNGNS